MLKKEKEKEKKKNATIITTIKGQSIQKPGKNPLTFLFEVQEKNLNSS
jgi:hypothetical protein